MTNIPGYTYGTSAVPRSPVTLADLELMKKTVLFGDEDAQYLRMSHDVLKDQVEAILDVWVRRLDAAPAGVILRPGWQAGRRVSADDVEKMYAAWVKSCLLQVTLWTYPYVRDGDF